MTTKNTSPSPRLLALFAIGLAMFAAACGGADRPGGYTEGEYVEGEPEPEPEPEPTDGGSSATCVAGDARECKILLPSQGAVNNCVIGTQYCDDGFWSGCEPPAAL